MAGVTTVLLDEVTNPLTDEAGAQLLAEGPVFPDAPLGVTCELNLAGTWTDITPYCAQEGTPLTGFTITRGRADETTTVTPSACPVKLNNSDGRFTIRNPTGPYYPSLVRNTPLRVSVPSTGTALRMEDDTTSSATTGAGFAAITGDIDIRLEMRLSGWGVSSLCGQGNWAVLLNGNGTLLLSGGGGVQVSSTMPVPLGHIAIRITRVAASGLVTFYTSPVISGAWTQLGAAVTGATGSMGGAAGQLKVGTATIATGANGLFYELQVYSGIGGVLMADPQFSAQAAGTTSFNDAQGNTWTLNGTAAISGRSYRFHGELSSLPQTWDVTGHDAWIPATASGPLRRLQQGSVPLPSPMNRAMILGASSAVAYWPCEDPQGSTQIASGLPGGQPMRLAGLPTFQGTAGSKTADSLFACSAQLPQVGTSTWTGPVAAYTTAGTDAFQFLLSLPAGGLTPGLTFFLVTAWLANGNFLSVCYTSASGGTLELVLNLNTGAPLATGPTGVNGVPMLVQVTNNHAGPTATLYTQTLTQSSGFISGSGTSSAANIASVLVNPGGAPVSLGTTEIGHIQVSSLASAITSGNLTGPLTAWTGETAGSRVARLAGESGYQSRVYGYPLTTAVMGVQAIDTLANLLQECEDADRGQLFEPRQCLGLGYRTSNSMTGQAAAVTLSVTADEVGVPLSPTDDDAFLRNDVIITRSGGSSAEVQVTSGPLSVSAPPAGAGDYATSLTVYVASDGQLPDIAGWMTHIGTADQERFPAVTVDLASTGGALQAVLPAVRDADIGDYALITGASWAWLPPGNIQQLIWGSTEHLGDFAWNMTWNTVPELPWEVLVLDDPVLGRLDTDGSVLAPGVTSGATSLTVATLNVSSPSWTTAAGDVPFDIGIAGEQVTVTAVANPSGTATSPGANQQLVLVTLAPGTIAVFWSVTLSGTLSASDVNNFALYNGTTFVTSSVNPATAGTYPQAPQLLTIGAGTPSIKVLANNAGTAGAVYTATFSSPQTFTVTRSVNGVVKAQAAGAPVALFHTPILALA